MMEYRNVFDITQPAITFIGFISRIPRDGAANAMYKFVRKVPAALRMACRNGYTSTLTGRGLEKKLFAREVWKP